MKKAFIFITVLCLLLTSFAGTVVVQAAVIKAPPLSMQILGKKANTTNAPIAKNNRIFLPVRATGEALSYKCSWNAKTGTMELKSSNQTIKITIGSTNAYVDGKKVKLDAAPIMYKDQSYMPLTFVQEHFNYTTTYDKTKNIVSINKKVSVTGGVFVFGKKISTTDLPYVGNDAVYVPLRHVGEALGYKVSWAAKVETMDLKSDNSTAKLTIGYGTGVVNGKNVSVSPTPIMYNERAYVPVSFIQDNFDYDVNYDKEKNVVNIDKKKPPVAVENKPEEEIIEYKPAKIDEIVYDDSGGFPQLNIVADTPVKYKSYTMMKPDRMVVDIENSTLNTEFKNKEIGKGGVVRVRAAQFSISPNVVRVVIDLEDQTRCKLVQSNDKKMVSLIYANIINPVSFIKEEGRNILMVRGSQAMDTNVFQLDNPDRLVVDIRESVLSEQGQVVETNTPYVKSVRTGQVDVGVARVVLDLEPGMYYDYKTEGSLTKVYISDVPFSFFDYKKYYNSAFIDLSAGTEVEYQPIIDRKNRILKIMIPKDVDTEEKVYDIDDNILESFAITKETYGNQIFTVAAFKMKPSVEYELTSPAITKTVSLSFKHKAKNTHQLTVLVDPGHGGKTPGAIAVDGTHEKTLNLDVSLRLNRILREIGFNTILVRNDDTYVDLDTRSSLANDNYVDFFMSIHFNAFNSNANGIETLYYPNDITEEYPVDNKKIANIFHKELIAALNRPSRGITPRPGLHVLNKTKMPAILAELGFITNAEEFKQIKKEEYRETAARALAVSIVKYFRNIEGISLDIDTDAIYAAPTPKKPYNTEGTELVRMKAAQVSSKME